MFNFVEKNFLKTKRGIFSVLLGFFLIFILIIVLIFSLPILLQKNKKSYINDINSYLQEKQIWYLNKKTYGNAGLYFVLGPRGIVVKNNIISCQLSSIDVSHPLQKNDDYKNINLILNIRKTNPISVQKNIMTDITNNGYSLKNINPLPKSGQMIISGEKCFSPQYNNFYYLDFPKFNLADVDLFWNDVKITSIGNNSTISVIEAQSNSPITYVTKKFGGKKLPIDNIKLPNALSPNNPNTDFNLKISLLSPKLLVNMAISRYPDWNPQIVNEKIFLNWKLNIN